MNGIVLRSIVVVLLTVTNIFTLAGCKRVPKNVASWGSEEARVSSPNGKLDAVLIRDDGGGAAGGWEWYVYLVAKGSKVDESKAHAIFNAGTLSGEKLVWVQEHLLEIRYNIAAINQFRNLWSLDEIAGVGGSGDRDFFVEIRLSPSSQNFSLLTPNGDFKSNQ